MKSNVDLTLDRKFTTRTEFNLLMEWYTSLLKFPWEENTFTKLESLDDLKVKYKPFVSGAKQDRKQYFESFKRANGEKCIWCNKTHERKPWGIVDCCMSNLKITKYPWV